MIPNYDGRDRMTLRFQRWRTQRCYVTTHEMRIREERRVLFHQHKWNEAEAHFLISLPVIIDRVKHGQGKWVSRRWVRLRVQWNTTDTNKMGNAMMKVMTKPQSSILYSLVSFSNSSVVLTLPKSQARVPMLLLQQARFIFGTGKSTP